MVDLNPISLLLQGLKNFSDSTGLSGYLDQAGQVAFYILAGLWDSLSGGLIWLLGLCFGWLVDPLITIANYFGTVFSLFAFVGTFISIFHNEIGSLLPVSWVNIIAAGTSIILFFSLVGYIPGFSGWIRSMGGKK